MDGRYNTRSPAVKRLMREAQELSEPTDQYFAQPLDDNLFEWHFTVRGPADSDFQHGIYHGRIILPVDYPMKPPSIIWLTPNGRFETNKKICLSISGHHPESWQPSWSIRTALLAIIGFMPTHPGGAIGSLDYTPEERKTLAKKSKDWKCPTCGEITGILLDVSANTQTTSNEAKELAAQINLQGEKPKTKEGEIASEQPKSTETQVKAENSFEASPEHGMSPKENIANTSTNIQQETKAPSQPSVVPNNQPIPQFHQWSPLTNTFPMPPIAFPFQYPGMPPMAPMQFPYPPSHYPAFPQYPWPPTPGSNEMYPNPFHTPPISVNNSSNHSTNTGSDASSNKNDQYSRSPMTCPVITHSSHPSVSNNAVSAESSNGLQHEEEKEKEEIKSSRGEVLRELLSKVNRVGSGTNVDGNLPTTTSNSDKQDISGVRVPFTLSKSKRSEHAGDQHNNDEGTDSEISAKSQKKVGGKSVSEMGDTNTEDNSESDVPPIDVDQSTGLDKGACSSTSELERWKQRYQMSKGIRQRQSATASVSPDLTEEGASVDSENGAVGQRIEAAVGDTWTRNRSRHVARLGNNANVTNRPENVRQNRQGSYDVGFFLMVGLFATSMLILFNRLIAIDWSTL